MFRQLSGGKIDYTDISVAKCRKYCKGFKYFAVQYGKNCFCGNKLHSDLLGLGKKAPDSDCNMACPGNASETCGGLWRNSLYAVGRAENAKILKSILRRVDLDVIHKK